MGLRSCLVCMAMLLFGATRSALGQGAGIEFNAQIYQSFSAVRQASADLIDAIARKGDSGLSSGIPVNDIHLFCGYRLTPAVLERGHYDGRYDPIVCFATEAESDRLYAENQKLRNQFQQSNQNSSTASPDGFLA